MGLFGMSWGSIASGLATTAVDVGVGVATGGVGLAFAPAIGAAVGGVTGALVNHYADGESWKESLESGALDGTLGAIGGGIGGKIVGKIGATVADKLGADTAEGILSGYPNLAATLKETGSKLWPYLYSGKLPVNIGSAVGESIANQIMADKTPKPTVAAVKLPTVDIGNTKYTGP